MPPANFSAGANKRLKSLELSKLGKKGFVGPPSFYRRMLALSALSVASTLVALSLYQHIAAERSRARYSGRSAPLEIDRLDNMGRPAATGSSRQTGATGSPPTSSTNLPVGLTIVKINPRVTPLSKASLGEVDKFPAPPPDTVPVSFPDRNPLDEFHADLPLAPSIEPHLPVTAANPAAHQSSSPVELADHVQTSPDLASAGSSDANVHNQVPKELSSALLTGVPHADRSGMPNVATVEANAVVAVLSRYSAAWSARRAAEITALRPGLSRRAVVREISSTRSISMSIQPTSAPSLHGDYATVECIHRVDQVFRDGVEKQSPGVKMTYVLVRRGGEWLIDQSH